MVSYQENLKASIPATSTPTDQIEKQNESGFTINGGLGGQYSFGRSKIFAEALIALPANQTNGQYVQNVIPSHFIFNVGYRFSLSSN